MVFGIGTQVIGNAIAGLGLAVFALWAGHDLSGRESVGALPQEGPLAPFMGEARFDSALIIEGERFPNVVIGTDGTVLATWGTTNVLVRRSEDGGENWGPEIPIGPGIHGGGVVVDESSGDIQAFVEEGHPPSPLTVYRSVDHGKTWAVDEVTIHPDEKGNVPSMHMNERGITLRHGPHAGRLLRPTRSYAGGNAQVHWPDHYTNAIFSDDGGKTWHTSAPFPAMGTGEATLEELSDGRIYYNSRRHLSTDGLDPLRRYIAWSEDGGETWKDLSVSEELPDGPQNTTYGLMAGLVRLPVEGHDILLFSNVDSASGRRNGHVWLSLDGGLTWPLKRRVEEGGFAYSSMAAGRPGTPSEGWIYVFYETGGHPHSGGKVARFNLTWVLEGALESASQRIGEAELLLKNALVGDKPGEYPAEAVHELSQAKLALEGQLDGLSLEDLFEHTGILEELKASQKELEDAIRQFRLSRVRSEGTLIFIEQGVALAMEEIGAPWQQGEGYLFQQGTGNALVTLTGLLDGDFHIEVLLSLDAVAATAASFVFNVGPPASFSGSHFGFDSGSRTLFVEGGFFGPTRLLEHAAADFIDDGEPFLFEAIREGETLRIYIDGVEVYQHDIGSGPIESLGLRPWRSEMRVYEFRVFGNLETVLLPELGSYDSWFYHHFNYEQRADPLVSTPSAAPAGDGVPNLLKYALDIDPFLPAPAGRMPGINLEADGVPTFVYEERTDISDVEYIAEVSRDLVDWRYDVESIFEVSRDAVGHHLERVGMRTDLSGDSERAFFRLRIEQTN